MKKLIALNNSKSASLYGGDYVEKWHKVEKEKKKKVPYGNCIKYLKTCKVINTDDFTNN